MPAGRTTSNRGSKSSRAWLYAASPGRISSPANDRPSASQSAARAGPRSASPVGAGWGWSWHAAPRNVSPAAPSAVRPAYLRNARRSMAARIVRPDPGKFEGIPAGRSAGAVRVEPGPWAAVSVALRRRLFGLGVSNGSGHEQPVRVPPSGILAGNLGRSSPRGPPPWLTPQDARVVRREHHAVRERQPPDGRPSRTGRRDEPLRPQHPALGREVPIVEVRAPFDGVVPAPAGRVEEHPGHRGQLVIELTAFQVAKGKHVRRPGSAR